VVKKAASAGGPAPGIGQWLADRWGALYAAVAGARLTRYLLYLYRRTEEDQLAQVAGSLTFTTLLSLVPLVTIALGLFAAFPLFGQAKEAIENFLLQSVLPRQAGSAVGEYVAEFADAAGKLTTVGLAGLAVTAAALMQTIFNAFDAIWRVARPRPLGTRILVYWASITLGPLLIGSGLAITTFVISSSLGWIPGTERLTQVILSLLVPFVLTTSAFTLLYVTVPNRDVQWRHGAIGGLAAGLGFELVKHLFGLFVTRFPTYHLIYGAFAAIPIFLVWIYLSWMVTLLGALLAATWPLLAYERADAPSWPGAAFADAMRVLALLLRARERGGATPRQIRTALHTAFTDSDKLLEQLREADWIGRLKASGGETRWVLVCDPDTVRVADVFRRFAFDAPMARKILDGEDAALARSMDQVAGWVDQGLGQSLAQAFKGAEPALAAVPAVASARAGRAARAASRKA
jgi:membrane protein